MTETWKERFDENFSIVHQGKMTLKDFFTEELSTLFSRIETEVIRYDEDETMFADAYDVRDIEAMNSRNHLRADLRQTLSTLRSEYGVKEENG